MYPGCLFKCLREIVYTREMKDMYVPPPPPSTLYEIKEPCLPRSNPSLISKNTLPQSFPFPLSFYFERFPPRWKAFDLKKIFSRLGIVKEVVVPNKLNRLQRRFGFICFEDKNNWDHLLEDLNTIWIGTRYNRKVDANKEKKSSEGRLQERSRKRCDLSNSLRDHRTFVDMVRIGRDHGKSMAAVTKKFERPDVSSEESKPNLIFDANEENMEWLVQSAVAYAKILKSFQICTSTLPWKVSLAVNLDL